MLEIFAVGEFLRLSIVFGERNPIFQHRHEEGIGASTRSVGYEEEGFSLLRMLEDRAEAEERTGAVGVTNCGDDKAVLQLSIGEATVLRNFPRELHVRHVEDEVIDVARL